MTRKELVAAVHAGTDGLRGMAAANAAVDIIIKTITALSPLVKMSKLIHSVNLCMLMAGVMSDGILRRVKLLMSRRGEV